MRASRSAALIALALLALPATCAADDEDDEGEYSAPLAGRSFQTELFGKIILVPYRNRRSVRALTLGALGLTPSLGDTTLSPLFNVYWYRQWPERRVYGLFSGVFNRVELAETVHRLGVERRAPRVEALAILETYTVPAPMIESDADGRGVDDSALYTARVTLDLGPGLRAPVRPFFVDNDLWLQPMARVEWDGFDRSSDTAEGARPPDSTLAYGGRLRLRLDELTRNLLELPHRGFALGGDLDGLRRDGWRDGGTRHVLRASGYALAALGVPFLSERHRLVAQAHGGWSPDGWLDRYSVFRLGNGPLQSETNDLARAAWPGAGLDQLPVSEYGVGSLIYRWEALFFLFLHARVTAGWGRVGVWDRGAWRLDFEERKGLAYSGGVTSGFVGNSQLYVEYTFDDGFVRQDKDGHAVLFMWSMVF